MSLFCVFEGIDGSGKTNLIQSLYNKINQTHPCKSFYEPTRKSKWGLQFRELMKNETEISEEMNLKMLSLCKKDRYYDLKKNIIPALQKGYVVFLDRYYFSTAAYQGREISEVEKILMDHINDPKMLDPDLLIYTDITPEIALSRIQDRNDPKYIFENLKTLKRVYRNYNHIFKHRSKLSIQCPFFSVNGNKSKEEMLSAVSKKIFHHLGK